MMKRHFRFLLTAAMMIAVSAQALHASTKRFINFNVGQNINVNVGLRFAVDFAVYGSDSTELNSGMAISDGVFEGEITLKERLSLQFDINLYGESARDLYLQYLDGNHTVKGGYFRDPSSMSLSTTQEEYRFVSRPATVRSLMNDYRVFGLSYRFANESVYAEQVIFTNDGPDDLKLETEFQNMGAAGRWLYKPAISDMYTFHIGVNARYLGYTDPTTVSIGSSLETNVYTDVEFLVADIENVKTDYSLGAEALFMADKYFIRGEYTHRTFLKERDDQSLFDAQSSDIGGYTTLDSWKLANPIRTTNFSGAYVEGSYLLLGDRYEYNHQRGMVSSDGMRGSLEILARYDYTFMNDITDGDIFSIDRFHQNGNPYDFASQSSSVGGGNMMAATFGVNYYVSKGVVIMANYTHTTLDNPYYSNDKKFSTAQLRVFVTF